METYFSIDLILACVASVSARFRLKKLGREPFFGSRSNFRAITRFETLATQANLILVIGHKEYVARVEKRNFH